MKKSKETTGAPGARQGETAIRDIPEQTDAAVCALPETGRSENFPIVGIGASAGGLAAFEAFFSGMPVDADTNMAFVLVQHLAPDHKSILTELIRRYTRMQVFEVEDGMTVVPNCAYIIPPNRDMAFLNGTLQLLETTAPRGQRLPIDFFFRSLAQNAQERSVAVVLSGTGSDGTLGVRDIKGEGGMVMAQLPGSTEYDGMPRSAIATGLVDYVLPPAEMVEQIIAYVSVAAGRLPSAVAPLSRNENSLRRIFVVLRASTGHDFSQYKPSTILRRIERRMAVHHVEPMDDYAKFLQRTPVEVDALFRELLIGVTAFFRDPAAFTAFESKVVPELVAEKPMDAVIRVWVPGCSTGEEAYSIAMLLAEYQEAGNGRFTVQIFATDIDSQSIATARAGRYPASIAQDISPERLARFFVAEPPDKAFRVRKTIRDMLIFSEQSVVKDPPFSKLDLISCRNLMIYMSADLQKKIIPLFHYALKPEGFLFLGTSETVGEFGDLFATLDRKAKLYQKKSTHHAVRRHTPGQLLTPVKMADIGHLHPVAEKKTAAPLSLRKLTEQALLQYMAPVAALVTARGEILYLHGRTGMYLEPAPGEFDRNILKMAREGLRPSLVTALARAAETQHMVRYPDLRVRTNGDFTTTHLIIQPVAANAVAAEERLYLVILQQDDRPDAAEVADTPGISAQTDAAGSDADGRIAVLKQELGAKEEYLRATNEALETANEELKSSNEEMQSINEELQSSNEELETSKEELQSVNEELATVNAELQTKVADLSRVNNDMNNLLAGTGIATIFVDHALHIVRFTPPAAGIINLILSDVGRPVGHIVSNLVGYDSLVADTQQVLDTLISREVNVCTATGRWYAMRIQPYRTLDNVIEGAVITFVDITEVRKSHALAERSQAMIHVTQRLAQSGAWEWDAADQALFWTDELFRMYGLKPDSAAPVQPEHLARAMACYSDEDRPVVLAAYEKCVNHGVPYDLRLSLSIAGGSLRPVRSVGEAVVKNGKVTRAVGVIMETMQPDGVGPSI